MAYLLLLASNMVAAQPSSASAGPSRTTAQLVRENGLSLALLGMFMLCVLGQIVFGLPAHNEERLRQGQAVLTLGAYLTSGHFLEALFENWESEFLQMALFVWLSAVLVQKGSAESRSPDEEEHSDEDPRQRRAQPGVPWPVRRGGWILWLYERSLCITFGVLFLVSWLGHVHGGWLLENEQRVAAGLEPQSWQRFMASSELWFQSFQNWQSEFLAILSIVVLTIFLRQRGSPQSKPVAAAHAETGN
jgi:hypothetical protein